MPFESLSSARVRWLAYLEGRSPLPSDVVDEARVASWSLWQGVLSGQALSENWKQVRSLRLPSCLDAHACLQLAHQGVFEHITRLENPHVVLTADQLEALVGLCPRLTCLKLGVGLRQASANAKIDLAISDLELQGESFGILFGLSDVALGGLRRLKWHVPRGRWVIPEALEGLRALEIRGGGPATVVEGSASLSGLRSLGLAGVCWSVSQSLTGLQALALSSACISEQEAARWLSMETLQGLTLCDPARRLALLPQLERCLAGLKRFSWGMSGALPGPCWSALEGNAGLECLDLEQDQGCGPVGALLANKSGLKRLSLEGFECDEVQQWPVFAKLQALRLVGGGWDGKTCDVLIGSHSSPALSCIELQPTRERRVEVCAVLPACVSFEVRGRWHFVEGSTWGQGVTRFAAPIDALKEVSPAVQRALPLSLTLTGHTTEVRPSLFHHQRLFALDLSHASWEPMGTTAKLPTSLWELTADWKWVLQSEGLQQALVHLGRLHLIGGVDEDDDYGLVGELLGGVVWPMHMEHLSCDVEFLGTDEEEIVESILSSFKESRWCFDV